MSSDNNNKERNVSQITSRPITKPYLLKQELIQTQAQGEYIKSNEVIKFLEDYSPPYQFEYIGYEVKKVDSINCIFLMINPDPRSLDLVPADSLVICHHKISVYQNRIYQQILSTAKTKKHNIYNFHLAWDTMEGGIGDSFLIHLGIPNKDVDKVNLIYKGNIIKRLGSIIKQPIPLTEIISRLSQLNVNPSIIINPKSHNSKIGYIPGGGFVDQMIIQMAEAGVDVLISADLNWVVEIIARELGITLISIDHYTSERYGLSAMRDLLTKKFPSTPVMILENTDSITAIAEILIRDLIRIAQSDGTITKEEQKIISSVNADIDTFIKTYKQVWEDNIITEEEKTILTTLWNDIYHRSVKEAEKDNIITKDEIQLLMRVIETTGIDI